MEYVIIVIRYWYGPEITKTRLRVDSGKEWRGTRAEARKEIAARERGPYYLSHNETSRPTYSIVRA